MIIQNHTEFEDYLGNVGLDSFVFETGRHKTHLADKVFKIGGILSFMILGLLIVFYLWNKSLRSEVARRTSLVLEGERRYKKLVENQSLMASQFLPDTTLTYVNETYANFFGVKPAALVGKRLVDIFEKPVSEELPGFFKAFTPDNAIQKREEELTGHDGEVRWVLWSNEAVFDESGTVLSFQSFGTDITQRKLMEQHLIHSRKMELVGQLTGGIAHDFNNLLQVILANLDLASKKATDDAPLGKMLSSAADAAKRGRSLIQQLMTFSRKEALSHELVDPNEQITDSLRILNRALSTQVFLETDLEEGIPKISIDINNFQNALLNLAVNSRQAMPSGGVFKIKTLETNYLNEPAIDGGMLASGSYVEISLSNSGCGMTEEVCEKATEPYFTTRASGEGSGLGLSMVYGFVHQSDGFLEIESEVGKGTTVKMIIPAAT